MTTPSYIIRGGLPGRERLRLLARVMSPTTEALLDRLGVASGARCLDAGCGGGDVTCAIAARVPDGAVVGIDADDTALEIARTEANERGLQHVAFREADVTADPPDDELGAFDVVYARFLLTHLTDPAGTVRQLGARLASGGVLIVEDIDFSGHFCYPPSPAFDRYLDWYVRAAERRGVDPNIGPRLPGLLGDAGLESVGMNVVQPAGIDGEAKLTAPITLEAIADAVLASGLCELAELQQTVDELYAFAHRSDTVVSLPRIVQAWGYRHADGNDN
jgi:SAM-dependent methyltransferase